MCVTRSAYAISLRTKLTLGIHEQGNTPDLQGAVDPTSGNFLCHSPSSPEAFTDNSSHYHHHNAASDKQLHSPNLLHLSPPTQAQSGYSSLHQSLAVDGNTSHSPALCQSLTSDARAGNIPCPSPSTSSVYHNLPVCTRASHNFRQQLGHSADPLPRPDSMQKVCRQMMFVHKMIGTWRRGDGHGTKDTRGAAPRFSIRL